MSLWWDSKSVPCLPGEFTTLSLEISCSHHHFLLIYVLPWVRLLFVVFTNPSLCHSLCYHRQCYSLSFTHTPSLCLSISSSRTLTLFLSLSLSLCLSIIPYQSVLLYEFHFYALLLYFYLSLFLSLYLIYNFLTAIIDFRGGMLGLFFSVQEAIETLGMRGLDYIHKSFVSLWFDLIIISMNIKNKNIIIIYVSPNFYQHPFIWFHYYDYF